MHRKICFFLVILFAVSQISDSYLTEIVPVTSDGGSSYNFKCVSTSGRQYSVRFYAKQSFYDLVNQFNSFVEDENAKMVRFWLDFPDYEGMNPLLYQSGFNLYGLWMWSWIYDQYGKSLLQYGSSAKYLSLGTIFWQTRHLTIEFTGQTDVQAIASLPSNCKVELGLRLLENLTSSAGDVQDKEGELCHRYVSVSRRIYHGCYKVTEVKSYPSGNITQGFKYLKSPSELYHITVLTATMIILFNFFTTVIVWWLLSFFTRSVIHKVFYKSDGGEQGDSTEQVLLTSVNENSLVRDGYVLPVTLTKLIAYWQYTYNGDGCIGSSSRLNDVLQVIALVFLFFVVCPLGLWVFLLVGPFIVGYEHDEYTAWKRFYSDDRVEFREYAVLAMLLPNFPANLIFFVVLYFLSAIGIIVLILKSRELSQVECVHHPWIPADDTHDALQVEESVTSTRQTGRNAEQAENSQTTETSDQAWPGVSNDDLRTHSIIYNHILKKYGALLLSVGNPQAHIYENSNVFQCKMHFQNLRHIFNLDSWKTCGWKCPWSLLCLPVVIFKSYPPYFQWKLFKFSSSRGSLPTPGAEASSVHELNVSCVRFKILLGIIICITMTVLLAFLFYFDTVLIIEIFVLTLTGLTLHIESLGPFIIEVLLILWYVTSIYHEFVVYYQNLKNATFEILQEDHYSPSVGHYVTDRKSLTRKGRNRYSARSDILLFKRVPIVRSQKFHNCISRDFFSYLCEEIYPVRDKFIFTFLKLSVLILFLVISFLVIRSFEVRPIVESFLLTAVGILPNILKNVRGLPSGGGNESDGDAAVREMRRKIRRVVKKYLEYLETVRNIEGEVEIICMHDVEKNLIKQTRANHDSQGDGFTVII